jgi:hypothetical protein
MPNGNRPPPVLADICPYSRSTVHFKPSQNSSFMSSLQEKYAVSGSAKRENNDSYSLPADLSLRADYAAFQQRGQGA